MAVVIVKELVTESDLARMKEEYDNYVKIVVDIENSILAAGGEWYAAAEKALLNWGSVQQNLWGGGLDLETGEVDYISLINTRPSLNNSQEVSDESIRKSMYRVISKIFGKYVKER